LHRIRLAAVGVTAAALLAGVAAATGFGATSNAAAPAARQVVPPPQTITVRAGEYFFKLSKLKVKKGTKVTFVLKNVGKEVHDFSLTTKLKKTRVTTPGGTARVTVTFLKKGRYPFICTIPRHAERGMAGAFVVTA